MNKRNVAIAMLPSLLTLGNLACGFMAISLLSEVDFLRNYRFKYAAWLIIAGMIFDMLDGPIARLTKQSSEFGGQLDSLADMTSFCIAPALLAGQMVRVLVAAETPRTAWIFSSVFAICGALRLARYNAEKHDDTQGVSNFTGLPSPGAAGFMVSIVLVYFEFLDHQDFDNLDQMQHGGWLMLVKLMPMFAMLSGLLMVSRFKYIHFANKFLNGRQPFMHLVATVFLLLIFASIPEITLLVIFTAFLLSGPVMTLVNYLRGSLKEEEQTIF